MWGIFCVDLFSDEPKKEAHDGDDLHVDLIADVVGVESVQYTGYVQKQDISDDDVQDLWKTANDICKYASNGPEAYRKAADKYLVKVDAVVVDACQN